MVPLISWQSISARSAEGLPARQCCGWRRQHERRSWRGRRGRGCRSGSRRRLQWPYWPSSCSCAAPRRAARTHSSSGMSCWVADKLLFFTSKHDRRRLLVRHVAEDAGTQPEANGTTRSARPASARVRAADRTSQGCHRPPYHTGSLYCSSTYRASLACPLRSSSSTRRCACRDAASVFPAFDPAYVF